MRTSPTIVLREPLGMSNSYLIKEILVTSNHWFEDLVYKTNVILVIVDMYFIVLPYHLDWEDLNEDANNSKEDFVRYLEVQQVLHGKGEIA